VVPVRGPVPARRRHGHLADRVPVVRGRDGQHIRQRLVDAGGRADVRVRPVAVLRGRMVGRVRDAGRRRRGHTGDYRRADGVHTGVALLSDDGRQTGRSGQVVEETPGLRRDGVQKRARDHQAVRDGRKVRTICTIVLHARARTHQRRSNGI